MRDISVNETNRNEASDPTHEERDELVPLAEPGEHGHIRPPDVSPVPPVPPAEARTPTVVKDRYVPHGTMLGPEAPQDGDAPTGPLPIIKPGMPGANTLIIAGAMLTLAAATFTGYHAPNHAVARVLSTLYDIAVHSGTGVVALLIASIFTERKFNDIKLGAARMFFMVALLHAIVSTSVPIPTKIDEWILGLLAYVLMLWGLFRLPRHDLSIIGITHAGLYLIVKLGAELDVFAAAAPKG